MKLSRAPLWLITTLAALLIWFIGAYMPALSNIWVQLNILAPAGKPHLFTFPLAYPAIGIDLHTLLSLIGAVLMLCAVATWFSYLERTRPHQNESTALINLPPPITPET